MAAARSKSHKGGRWLEWLFARKPTNLLLVVVLLVPLGTVGYVVFEGLGPLDALYQTMITLSTVGYQDLTHSLGGRLFNLFFLTVGVGLFVVTLSFLAAFLVEGRLREAIGRRRMERDIRALRNHVIVCGFGRFGQLVAAELDKDGLDHAILETDADKVSQAESSGHLALQADATEDTSLVQAGIHHARAVISTLDSDAANVYVALTAQEIRRDVPVITMARDPSAESKLKAAGANYVVSPYTIGAVNMARRVARPHLAEFLDSAHGVKVRLEEIPVRAGSPLVHQRLRDTTIRQRYGVTVVAVVKTREDNVRYNPDPELELEPGDVLVAVGPPEGLAQLAGECSTPSPHNS